jgi:hypothetical protein
VGTGRGSFFFDPVQRIGEAVNVTVDSEALKAQIREAFADVDYPGDWCLRGSDEGIEPYSLEEEFRGKRDKEALDAEFLDKAPDGLGSALCFFSDEALRFYLPAYLIADIDGKLERVDPIFFLLHGLDESTSKERVNPARYGDRTWLRAKLRALFRSLLALKPLLPCQSIHSQS